MKEEEIKSKLDELLEKATFREYTESEHGSMEIFFRFLVKEIFPEYFEKLKPQITEE